MRIISGEFRSRKLFTPPDDSITRPIPDRVKESLFGMLRGNCEGANVFDGFAGTGAIGLEALSRGGARCVFIEQDKSIAAILSQNVDALGVKDRAEVVVGDALGAGALARAPRPLTLAFLDPPYPLIEEPVGFRRTMAQLSNLIDVLTPDGFAVLRTPWPLRHREGPAPTGPAPARRKKGKYDRKEWKGEPEVEEIEQVVETPAPAPKWVQVSLTLPNAKGPETHVYHNMAVHLYMRK